MASCQKSPTRHACAWQIGPYWQDTLNISHYHPYSHKNSLLLNVWQSLSPSLHYTPYYLLGDNCGTRMVATSRGLYTPFGFVERAVWGQLVCLWYTTGSGITQMMSRGQWNKSNTYLIRGSVVQDIISHFNIPRCGIAQRYAYSRSQSAQKGRTLNLIQSNWKNFLKIVHR